MLDLSGIDIDNAASSIYEIFEEHQLISCDKEPEPIGVIDKALLEIQKMNERDDLIIQEKKYDEEKDELEENILRFYDGVRGVYVDILGDYMICDANMSTNRQLKDREFINTRYEEINEKVSNICKWNIDRTFIDANGMENRYFTIIPFRYLPADIFVNIEEGTNPYEVQRMYEVRPNSFGYDITDEPKRNFMIECAEEYSWYNNIKVHLELCDLDGNVVGEVNDYGYYLDYKGPSNQPNSNNPSYDRWAYSEVQTLLKKSKLSKKDFMKSELFHTFISGNMVKGSDVGYFQKLLDGLPESAYTDVVVDLPDETVTFKEVPSYIEYGYRSEFEMKRDDYKYLVGEESTMSSHDIARNKYGFDDGPLGIDISNKIADIVVENEKRREAEANGVPYMQASNIEFDEYNFGPTRNIEYGNNIEDEDNEEIEFNNLTDFESSPFDRYDDEGYQIENGTVIDECLPRDTYYDLEHGAPIFENGINIPDELVCDSRMYNEYISGKINDEIYGGIEIFRNDHFNGKKLKKIKKKIKKRDKKMTFYHSDGTELSSSEKREIKFKSKNVFNREDHSPDAVELRAKIRTQCENEWYTVKDEVDNEIEQHANEYVDGLHGPATGDIVCDAARTASKMDYLNEIYNGDRSSQRMTFRGIDETSKLMRIYNGKEKIDHTKDNIYKLIDKYDWFKRKYKDSPEEYYNRLMLFGGIGMFGKDGRASEVLDNLTLSPGMFASNSAIAELLAMEDSRNEDTGETFISTDQVGYLRNLLQDTYGEPDSVHDDIVSDVGNMLNEYGDMVSHIAGNSFNTVLDDFSDKYKQSKNDTGEPMSREKMDESYRRILNDTFPGVEEEITIG